MTTWEPFFSSPARMGYVVDAPASTRSKSSSNVSAGWMVMALSAHIAGVLAVRVDVDVKRRGRLDSLVAIGLWVVGVGIFHTFLASPNRRPGTQFPTGTWADGVLAGVVHAFGRKWGDNDSITPFPSALAVPGAVQWQCDLDSRRGEAIPTTIFYQSPVSQAVAPSALAEMTA